MPYLIQWMRVLIVKQVLIIFYSAIFATCDESVNRVNSVPYSSRRDLNFQDLAKHDGYSSELHYVTTEDGYILGVFRMPPRADCRENNTKPLIFMHGLYLSGDDCLIPGPGVAHCYTYVDNCYEVWVPNSRGNFYSRNHTRLNPDKDSEFWDFDIDKMALYDTPAVIDYVLKKTGAKTLTYVGHAQGATILLLLCAKRPEYNAKIDVGIGFSMAAWLNNAKFVVIEVERALSPLITIASNNGVHAEILARGGLASIFARLLCGSTDYSYESCSALFFSLLGYNEFQITPEVLKVLTGHVPAGTSSRNFDRWGQMKKNGFAEYDYGPAKNLKVYGRLSPPEIDLSQVTMKWVFVTSENDYVSDVKDVNILISKLPNASKSLCILSNKLFGHLDYIYGKDIPVYITPIVLSLLKTGDYVCT